MSGAVDGKRRAVQLIRWYPIAWREQHGDEFVDHLEQEIEDQPVDRRRTANVIYKGLVARIADIGLTGGADEPSKGRFRAVIGTSFALTALLVMFAINIWSSAMEYWGGRHYHPAPDTIVTAVLTLALGILLLMLVVIISIVAICVIRQVFTGRARPLVVPSIFALVSGALLLYSVRWLPRLLVQYAHGTEPLRPNPALSQPIRVIDEFARISGMLTEKWFTPWTQNATNTPTAQAVVNYLVPVAVLIFGISVALLIRRVAFPDLGDRLGRAVVVTMSVLTISFIAAYSIWFLVGGPTGGPAFWTGPLAGGTYLAIMVCVTVLIGRLSIVASRVHS